MVKRSKFANLGAAVASVKPAKGYDFGPSRTKKTETTTTTTTREGGNADSSLLPSDKTLAATRNTDRLYTVKETLNCTMEEGCVPCAYKIGCFDVALDKEFVRATPNQRPEQCPRSSTSLRNREEENGITETTKANNTNNNDGVMGFRRGMSILTVGDGDFSFSLGLARKLMQPPPQPNEVGSDNATFKMAQKLLQELGNNNNNNDDDDDETTKTKKKTFLVATSYESESTLRDVYPDFEETLRELDELGVHVAYNVDATRILETLSLPDQSLEKKERRLKRRFHRICWNFPCTAIGSGQDGQNTAMEENKELVRNFVENSRSVLTDQGDGELYICHKTKPPYNQWNLEDVAIEKQQKSQKTKKNDDKNDSGEKRKTPRSPPLMYFSGRIVLDRFLLPPYTPRKALDKKSFPCHDACFYIFAQKEPRTKQYGAEHKKTKKKRLFLPTIPRDDKASSKTSPSTTIVKIQPELIRLIREKHIKSTTKPGNKRKRNARHDDKTTKESSSFTKGRSNGSTKGRGSSNKGRSGSNNGRGGSNKARSGFDLQRF